MRVSTASLTNLPEILWDVVLQFTLHEMPKQGLDLIEHTLIWVLSVILYRQERLLSNKQT